MTQIVYEGIDGSVAISTLAPGVDNIDEVARKFRESHPGFYIKFTVHEKEIEVPKSREHRDAWVKKGNKIEVDKKRIKAK